MHAPQQRSRAPLLPTVCAMALLPPGPAGRAYAPAALRHLMTDPGSPVADLYQDCAACGTLRKGVASVQVELLQARVPLFLQTRRVVK